MNYYFLTERRSSAIDSRAVKSGNEKKYPFFVNFFSPRGTVEGAPETSEVIAFSHAPEGGSEKPMFTGVF